MKRDTQSRVGFGLIGAGGQARELAGHCNRPIDFYAVDRQYFVTGQQCVPLEAPGRYALKSEAVIAIGAPGAKRKAFEKGPGLLFGTVLANTAVLASTVIIGEGTVVAPGAFVMSEVRVGRHVLLNTGAIVSHDCLIGDFATISPGVSLGGNVKIGDGAFIGIGAIIRDGVTIGSGAVIGAGQ